MSDQGSRADGLVWYPVSESGTSGDMYHRPSGGGSKTDETGQRPRSATYAQADATASRSFV